jgi:predicted nucleic acid-binding protein
MIWYLRGNDKARAVLREATSLKITAYTVMELMQGMRNKRETVLLEKAVLANNIIVIYPTSDDSRIATQLFKQYHPSHAIDIPGAINAAVAIGLGEQLVSANSKHYSCIKTLDFKAFIP